MLKLKFHVVHYDEILSFLQLPEQSLSVKSHFYHLSSLLS